VIDIDKIENKDELRIGNIDKDYNDDICDRAESGANALSFSRYFVVLEFSVYLFIIIVYLFIISTYLMIPS
jgi:hypothetical protein